MLVNGTSASTSTIEADAENYALGYYACSESDRDLILVVGTNNSNSTGTSEGTAWGNMIDAIAGSSNGKTVVSQVIFAGGNDIESWHASTAATDVENWATGFDAATTRYYVDFGAASGCNETDYESGEGYRCSVANGNDNFTQRSYWYLSWGESAAEGAPEIYASGNGQEWEQICRYGYNVQGKPNTFEGPLTGNGSPGYSADTSWSGFYNALAGTNCQQTPPYEVLQDPE